MRSSSSLIKSHRFASVGRPSVSLRAVSKEVSNDCLSMLRELRGLEWQDTEVRTYLEKSVKKVKGFEDVEPLKMAKAIDVIRGKFTAEDLGVEDRDMSAALTSMRDLWRWKRRGGGMGWEEEGLPLSTIALYELQGIPLPNEDEENERARLQREASAANPDQLSSTLLDNLNLSDADKNALGKDIQSSFVAGVQSFLWSNLVLAAVALALLNVLMMKGGN